MAVLRGKLWSILVLLVALFIVVTIIVDPDKTFQQNHSRSSAQIQRSWVVVSPDGKVKVEVELVAEEDIDRRGVWLYRVWREDVVVLPWSPLGVIARAEHPESKILTGLKRIWEDPGLVKLIVARRGISNNDFVSGGLEFVQAREIEVREAYYMPHGKARNLVDHYNGLNLLCRTKSQGGHLLELLLRVYDDGVAVGYSFPNIAPNHVMVVEGELTGFDMSSAESGWLQEHGEEAARERALPLEEYHHSGFNFPALFRLRWASTSNGAPLYVLITQAGVTPAYCGTRLAVNRNENATFVVRFPSENEADESALVVNQMPFNTSWHLIILGELSQVVESSMVLHVSERLSPRINNSSWILPGVAVWPGFNEQPSTSASNFASASIELHREYMNSAAEFGWNYAVIGPEWTRWPNIPRQIRSLALYAIMQDPTIGVWVAINISEAIMFSGSVLARWMTDSTIRREQLQKLAAWGAAGVIIYALEEENQQRVDDYLGILDDAASVELMIAFHGRVIPRGWARKYPNLLTMGTGLLWGRSVFGSSGNQSASLQSPVPSATANVLKVLTRNIVGGMADLSLAFSLNLLHQNIRYGHTLALTVLLESPLAIFAGRADENRRQGFWRFFAEFPFVREFLHGVPVAWDETRFLSGAPSSHAIIARRFKGHWWIAGITADRLAESTSVFLAHWRIPWKSFIPPSDEAIGVNITYRLIFTPADSPRGDSLRENTGNFFLGGDGAVPKKVAIPRLLNRDGFILHLHLDRKTRSDLPQEAASLQGLDLEEEERKAPTTSPYYWLAVPLVVLGVVAAASFVCGKNKRDT